MSCVHLLPLVRVIALNWLWFYNAQSEMTLIEKNIILRELLLLKYNLIRLSKIIIK